MCVFVCVCVCVSLCVCVCERERERERERKVTSVFCSKDESSKSIFRSFSSFGLQENLYKCLNNILAPKKPISRVSMPI